MGIGVIVVPVLGVIETIAIGKAFGKFTNRLMMLLRNIS